MQPKLDDLPAFINDMHDHLGRKLSLLCRDTIDTCERADLDNEIIIKILMAGLTVELLKAVATLGIDEKQFIHLCRIAYREVYPTLRRRYENI